MRVLVVASPLPGHVLPLVTLAQVLQDGGHEVVVATTGDALAVCPPGLRTADVAPNLRLLPLFLRFSARHPRLTGEEATGRAGTRAAPLMWAPVNERMAPGVRAQADALRPDLVLCEPLA